MASSMMLCTSLSSFDLLSPFIASVLFHVSLFHSFWTWERDNKPTSATLMLSSCNTGNMRAESSAYIFLFILQLIEIRILLFSIAKLALGLA